MDYKDRDYELMMLIAKENTEAYQELLGKYSTSSVRFIERMLGSRSDAEDIMQDTCLKIWNEASSWKPKAKFSTWLYRVLFNACVDHKRKIAPFVQGEMEEFTDSGMGADDMIIRRQNITEVKEAMQNLPERQRAAVALCYYEEINNAQAAEVLGISLGTLKQTLFRARQNLKKMLMNKAMENGKKSQNSI